MLKVVPRNGTESYLDYQDGGGLQAYIDFTRFLGKIPSREFDVKAGQWYCKNSDLKDFQEAKKKQEELSSIGSTMKLRPYPYQKEAIAFCLQKGYGLIQLPCGAGKTPIGLGLFLELRKKDPGLRGIFVVKASLKNQWLDETAKFTDLKANILYTYKSTTQKYQTRIRPKEKELKNLLQNVLLNKDRIAVLQEEIQALKKEANDTFRAMFDASAYDIFIVNYETIADRDVRSMLHWLKPQFWYVDEIDSIKNCRTLRSKAVCEFSTASYRFGATATPIRKNPKDLFGIFKFLNPALFPDEKAFDRTYLTFWYGRVSGSQNEGQLARKVAPEIFTRTFDEISSQLPKQSVYPVYCELSERQKKVYKRLSSEIDDLNDQKKKMYQNFSPQQLLTNPEYKRLEDGIAARQTFAQMQADSEQLLKNSDSSLAHKYLTGDKSSKVETCLALVHKILLSGEKVCIFSRYLGIQDILEEGIHKDKEFSDIPVDRVTGSTPAKERSEIIKAYNTDPKHQVLLISDSGEAGLNLSSTRYMIEFELADSAAKQTQRHGRIQRADSIHKNVFVFQLICKGSWDEIQQRIISKKQGYAKKIL